MAKKNKPQSKAPANKEPKVSSPIVSNNPDFQQIQDLVRLVNENNIGELHFEKGNYKISLKQKNNDVVYATAPQIQAAPVAVQQVATPPKAVTTTEAPSAAKSNLITIKSPMIGTFYIKPAPDKADFVNVGTEIKKGQVLCIVEAMKLFNEIESEISGKIVKVLVNNASPIEFDQDLFLVEPA